MARRPHVEWTPGTPVTAERLNAATEATAGMLVAGAGIDVHAVGSKIGIAHTRRSAMPTKAVVRRFRVKSEQADYVVCRLWYPAADSGAGVEGTVDVNIAKPYLLRRTPFDGVAITYPGAQVITYTYTQHYSRSADDTVDTETQVMTPRYFVNEQILAVRGIGGSTGVAVSGDWLVWEDLNGAGRHWAKV